MAKKRAASKTAPVGLYWPCPSGLATHPRVRLALSILKGPKAHLVRCPLPSCGCTCFLGSGWQTTMGMSRRQAIEHGYTILE